MNLEESLALYAQGKDTWNAWAAEKLAERERLKTAGDWVESEAKDDWNPETRAWHEAANADFSKHIFINPVDFSGFEWPGDAWFGEVTFRGDAGFGGATFRGDAGFGGATFRGDAGFAGVTFRGIAVFGGATFRGIAGFGGATFRGNAGFEGATFRGIAVFGQSLFQGYTTFLSARFRQHTDFKAARGERAFSLAETEFLEVPDFEQAHFEEAPRLDNLRIEPGGFQPYGQSLDSTSSISGTDLAARWRALKRLAIQGHDHTRELKFFRGEIKAERWTEGNFWPSVFSYPYEWFSNFGGSLVRPLIWWVVSVASFACLYLGQLAVPNKPPVSSLGAMITGLFSFAGAKQLDIHCTAGDGEPWLAALSLSLRKGLLFFGFDSTGKINQVYGCLYGIFPKGESKLGDLPGSFAPVIPSYVSFLGTLQMLLSSVLIFLFLLALRNHFRIR